MAAAAALIVVGVVIVIFQTAGGAESGARRQAFVDSETGKAFEVSLEAGMTLPVKSPDTGKMTGVPGELCYWTADGKAKTTADVVLLNSQHLPRLPEPTFCPFCHRLVVPHNPAPSSVGKPPITETEYRQQSGQTYSAPSRDGR